MPSVVSRGWAPAAAIGHHTHSGEGYGTAPAPGDDTRQYRRTVDNHSAPTIMSGACPVAGPTVSRRMVGRGLKYVRAQSGISCLTVARAMEVSEQTLWRMESGRQGPKLRQSYVTVLREVCNATFDMAEALTALVEDAKKPVWWNGYRDIVPNHAELLLGLEEHAQRVTTFHPDLIPPLLQTPQYRRALAHGVTPDRVPQDVEFLLDFLCQRQERLFARTDIDIRVMLCETALHHPSGGDVLKNQLQHLLKIGNHPTLSIRILPRHAGIHPGLITGPFDMMEFPDHPQPSLTEPPMIYAPGYTTAHYLDRRTDIATYRAVVAQMERVALDEDASRQLLLDLSCENHG